jgi:polar amino acid transport system substrate-binding protein
VTPSGQRSSAAFALAALLVVAAGSAGRPASAGKATTSYTAAQAAAGAKEYEANCASCHGAELEGGAGPALTGPNLRTLAKNTHLTVGDMFAFLAQQMPLNEPATLKHSQYVDIMAYILKRNGYPAGTKPLAYDDAMKSKVMMTSLKSK